MSRVENSSGGRVFQANAPRRDDRSDIEFILLC